MRRVRQVLAKSNTCYMEAGSSVVVLNSDDNAISLQGHVRVGGNR